MYFRLNLSSPEILRAIVASLLTIVVEVVVDDLALKVDALPRDPEPTPPPFGPAPLKNAASDIIDAALVLAPLASVPTPPFVATLVTPPEVPLPLK